jgi:hypothetical protein
MDTYNYTRLTKLYATMWSLPFLLVCLILFLHWVGITVLISIFYVLSMSYMCTQFAPSVFPICKKFPVTHLSYICMQFLWLFLLPHVIFYIYSVIMSQFLSSNSHAAYLKLLFRFIFSVCNPIQPSPTSISLYFLIQQILTRVKTAHSMQN